MNKAEKIEGLDFKVLALSLLLMASFLLSKAQAQNAIPPDPINATLGLFGSVAYNSQNNNFLVVSAEISADSNVNGRIMSNDNKPVTAEFKISTSSGTQQMSPKVAFSPNLNKYLVVWIGFPDPKGGTIYGRFVTAEGAPTGDVFPIYKDAAGEASFFYVNSELAYDSMKKQFVLVWENRNPQLQVYLTTISENGTAGSRIKVATNATTNPGSPAITINSQTGKYCIVYSSYTGISNSQFTRYIYAKEFNPANNILSQDVLVASKANQAMIYPSIAYNSSEKKYLVAWDTQSGTTGTQGKFITSCSSATSGSVISLNTKIGTSTIAYNPKANTYGIIGQDANDSSNSYAVLSSTGVTLQSAANFNGGYGNFSPVIVANTTDGSFAAISSLEYSVTRFLSGIGAGVTGPTSSGGMTLVAQKELGTGTFPDVVFFQGKLYLAVLEENSKLNLYSFNFDLTGQQVTSIPYHGIGQAFPRLMVWDNVLWLAYRDGEDLNAGIQESIKLWRQDSQTVEDLGGKFGNDPVALGNGYVAWQKLDTDGKTWKVVRRSVAGGPVTVVKNALPTGISRILPDGSIKMIDDDRAAVPWGVRAWFANPLIVATDVTPADDNGVVGRFNNDASTEFNLWAGQRAHTPHAATDGKGNYAVATWNPTVRVATITGPAGSAPAAGTDDGSALVCDPWPTDENLMRQCEDEQLYNPPPLVYDNGTDPANPIGLSTSGINGVAGAYSSSNDKVLIVSGDSVNGNNKIMGVLLDGNSLNVEKNAFQIDQGPVAGFAGHPKAAFDPASKKFLVVWEDERSGKRGVYGRFISETGEVAGNDFAINATSSVLGDLVVDSINKKFVVALNAGAPGLRTIDASGTVSSQISVSNFGTGLTGKPNVTVNEKLNEYWISYVNNIGVMLSRINPKTFKTEGNPIQLSVTREGTNLFSNSSVEYSPKDSTALAIWEEDGRPSGHGIFGRTINDDLSVSEELEILTPQIDSNFSAYTLPVMNYNSWTNSFFITVNEPGGSTILVETDSAGFVYQETQSISVPPQVSDTMLQKLVQWLVPKVFAQTASNPPSANVSTPNGTLSVGVVNSNVVLTSQTSNSLNSPAPSPSASNPVPDNTLVGTALTTLISKIYVWALGIGALLALLFVVLGGFYYMTSAGNAEQASKGTEMIWGAIIGLALLFGSYLLLNTINPDLVNLKLNLSGFNQQIRK